MEGFQRWKYTDNGNVFKQGAEQFGERFDTKARNEEKESSYHNLLIGILSGNEDWLVKSNVEAGEGFADIIVETDDPDEGIIAELKYTKDFKAMEKSCEKALKQIRIEDIRNIC